MKRKRSSTALPGLPGKALVFLFVVVAILPLLAALASGITPVSPLSELGTAFALTATALLFLQFLSSGRYESLSGRVGIDRTMGFHRLAAYVLLLFALLHPLSYSAETFLIDPTAGWDRLTGMLASHRLRTGVIALVGLLVIVGLATIRSRLRYEYWRASHGLLAITVAGLVLHHAFTSGVYSADLSLELVWLLFAIMGGVAIGLLYIVRPWRMWHEDWRVESVKPLADRVWEMTLKGPDSTRLRFRGGQFIWLTLAPNQPPFHDHPFSIASAAPELPRLRLVISEAGDCTNGFGQIEPGTRAAIDGPHGSFILPKREGLIIMIAGGVGIAPLLGILGEAAAKADTRPFHLVYAARKSSALAGLDRLRELQPRLNLSVRCVVDDLEPGSGYLAGPLSAAQVVRLLDDIKPEKGEEVTALVCGSAGMMELTTDALLSADVPADRIIYEKFDYAAGGGRLDRLRRRQALAIFLFLVLLMGAFSVRSSLG